MANPRKVETIPTRIRQSSYGLACRIAEEYHLSIIDAIDMAMIAWDRISEDERAEITGAAHDGVVAGNDFDEPEDDDEDGQDFYIMRG